MNGNVIGRHSLGRMQTVPYDPGVVSIYQRRFSNFPTSQGLSVPIKTP
jgi:hypothetical protein